MSYAAVFFLLAVVAVVLGFGALAAMLAWFAKVSFVLGSAARFRNGPVISDYAVS